MLLSAASRWDSKIEAAVANETGIPVMASWMRALVHWYAVMYAIHARTEMGCQDPASGWIAPAPLCTLGTNSFVLEKFALERIQINVYQGVGDINSPPDSRFRPISVRARPKP